MDKVKANRTQFWTRLLLIFTTCLTAYSLLNDIAHPIVHGWGWNVLRHGIGFLIIGWFTYCSFAEPQPSDEPLLSNGRINLGKYEVFRTSSLLSIRDSKDHLYLPLSIIVMASGYIKSSPSPSIDILFGPVLLILGCLLLLMGIFWRNHCEYDRSRREFTKNGKRICRLEDIGGVHIKNSGGYNFIRLNVIDYGEERVIPLFMIFANEENARHLASTVENFLGLTPDHANS